jgi:hypothetical protein
MRRFQSVPLRVVASSGDDVIACLLSDDEWTELVRRVRDGDELLTMPCCQSVA